MGCVEPQDHPGNCPVCGMKLVEVDETRINTDVTQINTDDTQINADEIQINTDSNPRASVSFPHKSVSDKHHGHRTEDFLKKFWLSLILTIPIVLYSDIFQKISGIKLPSFEGIQYLILLLGSIVFFYGGFVFLIGAYREVRGKNPGMMTLIALAITSAYVYSVFAVLFKIGHEFFWELTTLITIMLLGHYFEMRSVSSAQRALQEIEKLLPDVAEVIIARSPAHSMRQFGSLDVPLDSSPEATQPSARLSPTASAGTSLGEHEEEVKIVKVEELKVGDVVLVRPGGKIPTDGVVVEGKSEVNESMITGESKPVLKEVGSEVIAGTINGDGVLKVKVTKIGEETFLAGIKRLIKEAQASKSKLQVLADVFAKYLTFIAVGIGSLSFIFWLIFQKDLAFAIERLVTVLVVACPHALGLAVPLVVAISTSLAIHNGFLIRNRLQLELARKIDIVLFDKTGTLTSGRFKVKEIITRIDTDNTRMNADVTQINADGTQINTDLNPRESAFDKRESASYQRKSAVLQLAASLNQYSQHFIAQGILEKAKEENIELLKVEEFENLTGRGVKGKIEGKTYYLGGDNLLKELGVEKPRINADMTQINADDKVRKSSRKTLPNSRHGSYEFVTDIVGTTVYLIEEMQISADKDTDKHGLNKTQMKTDETRINADNLNQRKSVFNQCESVSYQRESVLNKNISVNPRIKSAFFRVLGVIILEDEIREESFEVVKNLHQMGIKVAMITGDKKEVAEKVAKELGIDEYFAEVLPEEKVNKVKELQKRNLKVMMVGDGINDAPALMQADVGVAIGAGTNVAIESAGIILVRNDPRDIVKLVELSRKTYRKMIENLFWATGYNVVALPLAAGILAFKGILLSPALAAILMSLSTIIVAINALRLR